MVAPALAAPFQRPDDAAIRQASLVEDPAAFAAEVLALIGGMDSARHPYFQGPAASADLLHFLCLLHGRQPSVIEVAVTGVGGKSNPLMDEWLMQAGIAFERERRWLAQLVVSARPPSKRAGLTMAEQVVHAQRDAMLTLARSDRAGCAFGAAVALTIDWAGIRKQLGGGEMADMPSPALTTAAVAATAGTAASRRALLFGVTQMLGQHRALWDLLDARRAV